MWSSLQQKIIIITPNMHNTLGLAPSFSWLVKDTSFHACGGSAVVVCLEFERGV